MIIPKFLRSVSRVRSISIFALGLVAAAALAFTVGGIPVDLDGLADETAQQPANEAVNERSADQTSPDASTPDSASVEEAPPDEASSDQPEEPFHHAPVPPPAPAGTPLAVIPDELPTTAQAATTEAPIYFNDFADPADEDRVDSFVHYRDPFVVNHLSGSSDHAPGDGATCSLPEETRVQTRERPQDHVYLCHPVGDPALGHMMGFAMDTSGYGFVGGLPDQVFEGVREVSVDINATDAGNRNFVEIKVMPASATFVNGMPCGPDFPCNAGWDYDDIDAVGVSYATTMMINTPDQPDGYIFDLDNVTTDANGETAHLPCVDGVVCHHVVAHPDNLDIRSRWQHIFRDNGDGTLSFGLREENQTRWVTAPGSFPEGPVRVVVAFHTYTGTKGGHGPGFENNLSPSTGGFTWHWDNLAVVADRAVPSEEFFGGVSADSIVSPAGCLSFSQGQRGNPNPSDIAPQFVCTN